MLPPEWLCRLHLLNEHNALHKHRPSFLSKFRPRYYKVGEWRGNIDPLAMQTRHRDLAAEMEARGFKHSTPYQRPSLKRLPDADLYGTVDLRKAERELRALCPDCAQRIRQCKLAATLAKKRAERGGSKDDA